MINTGKTRFLPLLLLPLWIARMGAFDLEGARRATAKPSPTTAQDPNGPLFWQWYARYTEPLHKDVALLCGNGRVDTFEDYTVFYQQNPNAGAFTMPGPPRGQIIPIPSW